ncbi:hypothetical protein KOR42_18650 [Thalassoglobus neptunius]|uniref:Zinc finger/thioredoxin putative domain-containing protein n=1 Tax=Thalassoglobus neptunius TaxID=1938619 RepID=A0A5C5X6C7_9PLAN|nr:Ig-like domain-containing protein [Thalassoglobus neptunius]TWT58490.1 hypothetical protein KOR42_18650 [Thalassoglobus neptunius]
MTIRYQCPECDQVLKIRDDKAGSAAKCPSCKNKFVVPEPTSDESSEASGDSPPVKKKASSPKTERPETAKASKASKKSEAKTKPAADPDEFDPADFLMEDGPGAKASAGLVEKAPADKGPATDSQGRRLLTPNSASAAKRASMSPAAAAAEDASINASANARDLLTKTMDESRVKASSMPAAEKKPSFDFSGAQKELIRYSPHIGGALAAILVAYFIAQSIFGEGVDLPPLYDVSGTVTVNGKALPNVTVIFEPLDATKGGADGGPKRLRTSTGVTDENGYFSLYYMQGERGAPKGKGRIWLQPNSAADVMKIPPEYAGRGNDIREVREAGNEGKFNIEIEQKPPQQ